MNYDEMYSSLNKGVPNMVTVEIPIGELLNECSSDTAKLTGELYRIRKEYEDLIYNRMHFSKAQRSFSDNLYIMTNYKTSETTIHVSPLDFLRKIKEILGVENKSLDFNDLELKSELETRLKELKAIKDSEELKIKFPLIYEDYLLSFKAYQKIKAIEAEITMTGNTDLRRTLENKWHYYDMYGLDTRFKTFLNKQCEMYRRFIARRQFVVTDTRNNPLDLTKFTGLDKNKFELYIAYRYMTIALNSKDEEQIQGALYYISSYLNEATKDNKKLSTNITTLEGKKIDFKVIYHGLKTIMKKHPSLKPIPVNREVFKGYHMKHVINHMNKYYGNEVGWVMVKNGDIYKVAGEVTRQNLTIISDDKKQEIMLKRFAELNKKVEFYENSGYLFAAIGINHFTGYLAFFYPNGEVLMDKWYEDTFGIMPAYKEAIYNVKAKDYERLSPLDKQTLRHNTSVKVLNHTPTWTKRAQTIIDRKGTEENIEAVKILAKKYQKEI